MIKARIRWCTCRVENILTLGKLLNEEVGRKILTVRKHVNFVLRVALDLYCVHFRSSWGK